MHRTHHAEARCQQRGIPPLVIDLLLQFGTCEPAGTGARKVFFDKPAKRRVKAYAGPIASLLDEHLDVYLVVNDTDTVITAAHRFDRIRRH